MDKSLGAADMITDAVPMQNCPVLGWEHTGCGGNGVEADWNATAHPVGAWQWPGSVGLRSLRFKRDLSLPSVVGE